MREGCLAAIIDIDDVQLAKVRILKIAGEPFLDSEEIVNNGGSSKRGKGLRNRLRARRDGLPQERLLLKNGQNCCGGDNPKHETEQSGHQSQAQACSPPAGHRVE